MKYDILKKRFSLFISAFLIFNTTMILPINAQNKVIKYETVYTNLKNDGSERETIVSNWLKDSRLRQDVLDKTDISNINNVNSYNSPIIKNQNLIWNSNSKDIYYQGETKKNLPISTKITYYLDGKQISAKDITGKSGKVKIQIKFTNNTKRQVFVNGHYKTMSTPFTVATVIGFDDDKFSDIEAQNSKIFSDGNNQMVMFIGFPGLENSLDLQSSAITQLNDINIPDEFTITANTKNFELSSIAIVASPQIPDMLKDIKKTDNMEETKKDIDIALNSKDKIKKLDPDDMIKNLIKDQNQTNNARILIDDLFEYYELDKALLDILPKYITDENIKLYDDVKKDLKDVDINYILDNEVLRYIPDRLNDEQIDKSRVLISDYEELKTFDMDRFDKALEIINSYDEMKDIIDASSDLYDKVKNHNTEFNTLDKAIKHMDSVFNFLDKVNETHLGGALSESDIDYMLKALAEKKTREISQTYTSLLPQNEKDPLSKQQQLKLVTLIDNSINSGQIEATTASQLKALISTGYVPEPYRSQLLKSFSEGVQREVVNQISQSTSQARDLLYEYDLLKIELENDMGYNYQSEMRTSIEFLDDIMPQIRRFRDLKGKNEELIRKSLDLAQNEDDMKYFQFWANRAKEMKKDMDNNDENIQIMKDILNEYDNPKINYFYKKIPSLRRHMDNIRPILKSLSDELDIDIYNKEFHKSPETLKTLLRMRDDLDKNKSLADTLKLSLSDEVVSVARQMIELIEKYDEKKELEKTKDKLDDIKDIIDTKDSIIKLADEYKTFTGKQDDMDSKVTFVMKTDEIKIPKKKEQFVAKTEEKKSFLEWLAGIFS